MKKVLAVALGVILLTPALAGCAENARTPVESFNFILKYGITAKNVIDTYGDKFTKDMITAPSITIDLRLTEEEMDRIYQKMVEIKFFDYPETFKVEAPPGEPTGIVTPYSTYIFTVETDGRTKTLQWDDEITNPDEKTEKLRELINLIREIIESREEYKQLPEPEGGYL